MGKGPSRSSTRRQAHDRGDGQRAGPLDGEVTADAMKLAKAITSRPATAWSWAAPARPAGTVRRHGIALVSGVGLMYLILVMQFGSFTAPLAVMLSLPLSLIGVVLALLLTHGTLNLMSFIGIIMLMGLVAKNAILLLDAARAGRPRAWTARTR